jgi:inner membrane protein
VSARGAALAGALGAQVPDADIFIRSAADPLLMLEYHRHFTHSFAAAPVGAALTAAVLWLLSGKRWPFAVLFPAALAGYLSAILLDACTPWGTQLLWPFSGNRVAFNLIAAIDPVFTLALATGVVIALRRGTAAPARAALAAAALYLAVGWLQHERAERFFVQTAAARGHAIEQHEVKPTFFNNLVWRSIYRTGDTFVVDAVRLGVFAPPVLYPGGTLARVTPASLVPPLTPGSVQAMDAVRFSAISGGYLARHPQHPDVIGDSRYSIRPDGLRPIWGIEVDAERENEHVGMRWSRETTAADRQRFYAMLRGLPLP